MLQLGRDPFIAVQEDVEKGWDSDAVCEVHWKFQVADAWYYDGEKNDVECQHV